jgi:signal transduction histidine kinase
MSTTRGVARIHSRRRTWPCRKCVYCAAVAADRGLWLDAALAISVAGAVLADALLATAPTGGLAPVDYVLLLGGTLVLAARRHAPRTTLLITVIGMVGYSLRVAPDPVVAVPVLIALYTVVEAGHRLLAIAAAVPLVAGTVANSLANAQGRTPREAIQAAILPVGWFVAAVVAGEVSRHRGAYLRQVEQRAADAERTREEVALRRAEQERLRIARELHDSLTHSISIIKVHAGVAVHLARKRGEPIPEALLAIQAASADATRELRDTLHVLRNENDGSPSCGLPRLPELVAQTREAGLPVELNVTGQKRDLPAEVDRAAYRIVQEALNNVARHAGPATASVTIEHGQDAVTVRVDDDGGATTDTPLVPGVGLIGMRERVTALGGRLSAAPRPQGGFTVHAVLPLPGPTS